MKLKILSLVLIAILAISAIGNVTAGTLTLNYPSSEPVPNGYRWTGDAVEISPIDTGTDGRDVWICDPNAPPIGVSSAKEGYHREYNISSKLIGKDLYFHFTDDTFPKACTTILEIKNYNGGSIYINFWDRGSIRSPHIDVDYYNHGYKDGANGNDIIFD
ncbi:MAG: hypothetical protein LBT10_02705 [Methanobrevibacter sp.]|jgi:hypothetical protein|nr:hypothetical protein [Methanobrevibacter sp.]